MRSVHVCRRWTGSGDYEETLSSVADQNRSVGRIRVRRHGDQDHGVHGLLRGRSVALGAYRSLTCFRRSTGKTLSALCSQAMVLCHFLDNHRDQYNLMDKSIIELGAGTGLVTIVTSLLGESQSECAMQEYFKS